MKNILISTKEKWMLLLLAFLIILSVVNLGVMITLGITILIVNLMIMIKKPIYSILVYIVGLALLPDIYALYLGILVNIVYIVHFIKKGEFKYKHSKFNLNILLLAIVMLISTVMSINIKGSFRDFTLHFVGLGILFFFLHSDKRKKDLYIINTVFSVATMMVAVYGIYQFINGIPMESGWVDMSQNPDLKVRVFATFQNPNLLAEYLIMMFPISLSLVFYNRDISKKIMFGICSIIILITIGLTYSRGGWMGLIFSSVIFLLLMNWRYFFGLIPMGIMGIVIMPKSIFQRLLTVGSLEDSSNFYRYNLWSKSIEIIKDFWFSGVGLGYIPFRDISHLYITNMAPYHTHNTYLQIAIETGIFGLLAFLILTIQSLVQMIKLALTSGQRFYRIFVSAFVASICGVLLHGLAEHIFYNPKIILTYWLVFTMLINYYQIYKEEKIV